MSNLIDLDKFIKYKEDERKKVLRQLNEINKEIKAAEMIRNKSAHGVGVVSEKSEISEHKHQKLINSLKYQRRKNNMTQLEAINKIAKEIRDENKSFRLNEVKNIMVIAGFFKTPRNANNILYTMIDRNRDKFEKIKPGIYRLIKKEKE